MKQTNLNHLPIHQKKIELKLNLNQEEKLKLIAEKLMNVKIIK